MRGRHIHREYKKQKKREPDVSRTEQSSILARFFEGTDIASGNPTSKFNAVEAVNTCT